MKKIDFNPRITNKIPPNILALFPIRCPSVFPKLVPTYEKQKATPEMQIIGTRIFL